MTYGTREALKAILDTQVQDVFVSDEVKRLENELADALQFKAALNSEVESILNANSFPPEPSGTIAALPVELLVEILYLVVAENPMHICRLMLVSCFWRQMIESTPTLWSAIRIVVPESLSMVEKCVAYCATCIERSAQCSLDISLDYTSLKFPALDFSNPIAKVEKRILGSVDIPRRDWMEDLGHKSGALLRYKSHLYLKPLYILSGAHNGFNMMKRWRSFEFMGGRIIKEALGSNSFRGITPILERFKIGQEFASQSCCYLRKPRPQPFPHTPRLRELSLYDIAMPYQLQYLDPMSMKKLDLQIYEPDQLKFVVRCRNLTSLRIGIPPPLSYSQFEWKSEFETLPFPQLRHFTICDWLPHWFWRVFSAPLLQIITYVTDYLTHSLPKLLKNGSVTRVELRWYYLHIDDWRSTLKDSLGAILLTESVNTIFLHNTDRWRVEQVLKGLKGTGRYPMSGKTLFYMKGKQHPELGASVPLTEEFVDSIVVEDQWCKFT